MSPPTTTIPWGFEDAHVEDGAFVGPRIVSVHPDFLYFTVAYVPRIDVPRQQANAAFIVRAVNSHQALVEALKLAENYMHLWMQDNCGKKELDDLEQIEAALESAEGHKETP